MNLATEVLSASDQNETSRKPKKYHGAIADIHSIDNDIKLLLLQTDKKSIAFQDEQLTGTQALSKTIDELIEWITKGVGMLLNGRIPHPLNIFYQKLRTTGYKPSSNLNFLYATLVFKLLGEVFPGEDRKSDITMYFTDWMCYWPEVTLVLSEPADDSTYNLRERVLEVPRFRDPAVQRIFAGLLQKINGLNWPPVLQLWRETGQLSRDSDVAEYVREMLWPQEPMVQNSHVRRMLLRLARIGADPESDDVVQHLESTADLIRSFRVDLEDVRDIEDGMRTAAELICTEDAPKCSECPVKGICNAYKKFTADSFFSKMFIRAPHYLQYSLSKACEAGKECVLCSLDPCLDCVSNTKGVTIYPTKNRFKRRHEALCLIQDRESEEYLFLRNEHLENETPHRIMRIEMHVARPSSEETFAFLKDRLTTELRCKFTALSAVERDHRADYISHLLPGFLTVNYIYFVSVQRDRYKLSGQDLWITCDELSTETLNNEDWTAFQNALYYHQLVKSSPTKERAAMQLSDFTKLRTLQEKSKKHIGNVIYSSQ